MDGFTACPGNPHRPALPGTGEKSLLLLLLLLL